MRGFVPSVQVSERHLRKEGPETPFHSEISERKNITTAVWLSFPTNEE